MKSKYLFLFGIIFLIISCTKENINDIEITPIEPSPDTIVIENEIFFSQPNGTNTLVEGTGYEYEGVQATLYLVASEAVQVECPGGLASAYNGGGDFFQIQFYTFEDKAVVLDAGFSAVVDEGYKFVFNLVPPPCIENPVTIDYEIKDGRIIGTVTGEFFYINPVYTAPFENCDNFISVGNMSASFDLPLINCN